MIDIMLLLVCNTSCLIKDKIVNAFFTQLATLQLLKMPHFFLDENLFKGY